MTEQTYAHDAHCDTDHEAGPEPCPPPRDAEALAGAVAMAYVHSNEVAYSWHHSVIELMGWDFANHGRIVRGGFISIRYGTDGLVEARNKAVATFLHEGRADWLFWLDTDMGFAADALDRLMAVADPDDRPIVGGLCFSQRELTSDDMGGWRCSATPTVFDWAHIDDQMGFAVRWEYPDNTAIRVAGTGSACILIHRSAFERIDEKFGPVWYDRVPNTSTGQVVSEDLAFCMRAGTLDIPVHVHTGVKTTHQKALWLAEDDYLRQRALDAAIKKDLGRKQQS